MIKAVIFDMDGVIVDTEMVYKGILRDFWDHCGFAISEKELLTTVGSNARLTWHNIISQLDPPCPWDFDTYIANYREFAQPYWADITYRKLLNPGVQETLAELKRRGYEVALASSSAMTNIVTVLAECEIRPYFSLLLSGDDFRESKPHPEIYRTAATKLGLTPAECVVIEDSPLGIRSALDAGMTVIAKTDERLPMDQRAAHYQVGAIPEILPLIASLP